MMISENAKRTANRFFLVLRHSFHSRPAVGRYWMSTIAAHPAMKYS